MKKVLFVVGVIALSVLLLLACMTACGDSHVVSAKAAFPAYEVKYVVTKNYVDFCDFSSITSVSTIPLVPDQWFVTNAPFNLVYDSTGVYQFVQFTGSGSFVISPQLENITSAYILAFTYYKFSSEGNSISLAASRYNVSTGNTISGGSLVMNANGGYTSIGLYSSVGEPLVTTYNVVAGACFKFCNVKPSAEATSSSLPSAVVVPGYSYDVLPGYFDDWDYMVRPNLLKGSDFYQTPMYLSALADPVTDYWTTNLPSSAFEYQDAPLLGDSHVTIPGDGSSYSLSYRTYVFEESYSYMTFSISFASTVGGVVSFKTYYGTPVTYSFGPSELVDGFPVEQFITLTLENINHNALYMTVTFDSSTQDEDLYLIFSKLEISPIFTGYVPIEHDISFWVRDNLLNNYNFASVPIYPAISPTTPSDMTDQWLSSYDYNYYYSDGGLVVDSSSLTYFQWLYYHFDTPSLSVGRTACFTLDLYSDTPIRVTIANNYIYAPGTIPSLLAQGYYLVAPDSYSVKLTFTLSEEFYIFIQLPAESVVTLYGCKLETGENFTGFCPSFSQYYIDGYKDGYTLGYSEGTNVYASTNIVLPFENVESPYVLDVGWTNWGFSSYDDFAQSYFVLNSRFYDALGYSVLSSGLAGTFDTQTGAYNGVILWISRDAEFNFETDQSTGNYCRLLIMANKTYLVLQDDTFPSDWNPVRYTDYRTFDLHISKGASQILEEVGNSNYNQGLSNGISAGYTKGYQQGKADGFTLANDVKSNQGWLGFFSAFVDVPVMVLTSLLDFDFFGFNLFSLVRILVFVSLFYLVIRLLTKGKVS